MPSIVTGNQPAPTVDNSIQITFSKYNVLACLLTPMQITAEDMHKYIHTVPFSYSKIVVSITSEKQSTQVVDKHDQTVLQTTP